MERIGLANSPTEPTPKPLGKPENPSRRWFMLALLSGAAAALLPRSAPAQTVCYDRYGNPVAQPVYYDAYGNPVAQPSTTVVVAPPAPVVAAPVLAWGSMRRQSRRVARRTARRTSRRVFRRRR
jgi:hypothetical protein